MSASGLLERQLQFPAFGFVRFEFSLNNFHRLACLYSTGAGHGPKNLGFADFARLLVTGHTGSSGRLLG